MHTLNIATARTLSRYLGGEPLESEFTLLESEVLNICDALLYAVHDGYKKQTMPA